MCFIMTILSSTGQVPELDWDGERGLGGRERGNTRRCIFYIVAIMRQEQFCGRRGGFVEGLFVVRES